MVQLYPELTKFLPTYMKMIVMMIDVNLDLLEPATAHLFSLYSQLLQIGVRGEEECQCCLVSKMKKRGNTAKSFWPQVKLG